MKKAYAVRADLNGEPGMVPRKPLKSLTAFFISIHILFGIDYGFANLYKGKVQSLLKWYSTVLFIVIIIAVLHPFMNLYTTIWYWVNALGFILYFILLKRTKYSVFSLLIDFHNLEDMTINNATFGVIISIYTYLMFILLLCTIFISCFFGNTCTFYPTGSYEVYIIASNVIDCYPVSTFVISYYIYTAVKEMKFILKTNMDIGNFIRLYKIVADTCDKIRPLYDNIVSMLISLDIV